VYWQLTVALQFASAMHALTPLQHIDCSHIMHGAQPA
jgi:hypothetical protein